MLDDLPLPSFRIRSLLMIAAKVIFNGLDCDWRGLIHYDARFFLLQKLAAVIGAADLDIHAGMRGQLLAEFQNTRNQRVAYSVAAQDD